MTPQRLIPAFALATAMAVPAALAQGFDAEGVRHIAPGIATNNAQATALALQPDGGFVVGGVGVDRDNADNKTLHLRRFQSDGSDAGGFSISLQHSGELNLGPRSLLVQPDGAVIAAYSLANASSPTDSYSRVVRYSANGSDDPTFINFRFDNTLKVDQLSVLALQADGKILAAGSTSAPITYPDGSTAEGQTAIVARLNADGTLDSSFNNDGYVRIPAPLASPNFFQRSYPVAAISSVNLLPDGRIFLAGTASSDFTTDSELLFLRLNADGSRDPDFNNGQPKLWAVRTGLTSGSIGAVNTAGAADVAPDGSFVIAGRTTAGGSGNAVLLLFDPSGTPLAQELDALGTFDRYSDVQLLPTGGVVAVGSLNDGGTSRGLMAIYPDGLGFTGFVFDRFGSQTRSHLLSATAYDPEAHRLVSVGSGVVETQGLFAFQWALAADPLPGSIDVLPDPFTFPVRTNVASGAAVQSQAVDITGLGEALRIPLRLFNGDARVDLLNFTDTPPPDLGTLRFITPAGVPPVLSAQLGHTAAASADTVTQTRLTIGGVVRSTNLALTTGATRTGVFESRTAAAGAAGSLRFATTGITVTEGERAELSVERSDGSAGAITVDYDIVEDASGNTVDAGTLTWADGEIAPKRIGLDSIDDNAVNGSPRFTAQLRNPTGGATLGTPATATFTFLDNDVAGSVRFTTNAVTVTEGQRAQLDVERVFGDVGAVSVEYQIVEDSSGTVFVGGTLSWADGEVTPITVGIGGPDGNDNSATGDRTFTARLLNATGGLVLDTPSTAILTVLEDDVAGDLRFMTIGTSVEEGRRGELEIERIGGDDGAISVRYEIIEDASGTVFVSGRLDWAHGDTSIRRIGLDSVEDSAPNGSSRFTARLLDPAGGARLGSPAVATITFLDNDVAGSLRFTAGSVSAPEGQRAQLTIARVFGEAGAISVQYQIIEDASGTVFVSGTLNWPAGDAATRTIGIGGPDSNDNSATGDRRFTARLLNPTGGAALDTPSVATITIVEDDVAGSLRFADAAVSVTEGQRGELQIERVSGSDGAVSVGFEIAEDASGTVYVSGTLRWAHGDASTRRIGLDSTDDATPGGDRRFTARLLGPSGGATLGTPVVATITFLDDDAPAATPSPTPVGTPTATAQPTAAPTPTPTPSPTPSPAPTPVSSPVATPAATATPRPTAAPSPAATPRPTSAPSATPAPTAAPSQTAEIAVNGGQTVTVSVASGTLVNARTVAAPAALPADFDFPIDFIAFDIREIAVGATVAVTVQLPAGIVADTYVKCANGSCAPFAAAVVDGTRITLELTDGGAGDADGVADGVILDPGAPAIALDSPPPESRGNGGALGGALLLALGVPALLRRRRSSARRERDTGLTGRETGPAMD